MDKNETSDNINFDDVKIHAYITNGKLLDGVVRITVSIDIDQFRTWLLNNYYDGIMNTRNLWNNFCKHIKKIINYGYHFNNIQKVQRFVDVDATILHYANEYNINVCTAGEIDNFQIADDQNSVLFDLIAEAYSMDDDPDATIHPVEELPEEPVEENTEEDIDNMPDTEEELEAQLLDQYDENHIAHARIADTLMMKSISDCSNEEFFKQLAIVPKITSHTIDGDIISFKLTITKKAFTTAFELYRDSDSDEAWNEFCDSLSNNADDYIQLIHASNFGEYMTNNNVHIVIMHENIYNVEVTNNNKAIRFWTDAALDED